MFKRMVLVLAAAAMISIGSTAMAHYPYRGFVRSYYAPAPVVSYGYRPSVYSYHAPYRSYYYGYPGVRTYYAPPVRSYRSYYAPAPTYVYPYGGVTVGGPGVSVRIGF